MKLRIAGFAGEIPRSTPRLLQDNYAQFAANTKLDNGAITPMRRARLDRSLGGPNLKTFYLANGVWLSWDKVVNIAQGPVAQERFYWTGDGPPKMRVDGTVYNLAVPKPTAPLGVLEVGTPDTETSQTVVYAYTNVTKFGEESEPSPLSGEMIYSPGMSMRLGNFQIPPGRGITTQRIYRSVTSTLGVTTLNFIAERAASLDEFLDTSLEVQEPIPSTDYNMPPESLAGLSAGPNGMMAAFVGKDVYFSEPYIPHAWPEKYVLTVDAPIVGLGWIGSSLVIMTRGSPYIATGTAPETMTMEKLEVNLPCINAQGIVDLGYTIAYPSHSGLVTVTPGGASVATETLITRDQWLKMNPYSFKAAQYAGRYMAAYNYADDDGVDQRGTLIIDLSGGTPFIIRNYDFADAMYYHVDTGALYIMVAGNIYEWDALSEPFGEQTWRSKLFVMPTYTNFGAILVEGEDVSSVSQRAKKAARSEEIRAGNAAILAAGKVGGGIGSTAVGTIPLAGSLLTATDNDAPSIGVTIIADGREVGYVDRINDVARLPGGFTARTWEVIVRGNVEVTGITLATTPSEIAAG